MPRVVSFIVLVAILLLMGAIFFQVMAHFVVPLFLAAVLVVVFKPLHAQVVSRIPAYPRVAAMATTLLILLAVLLPTVWLGWRAALECRGLYRALSAAPETPAEAPGAANPAVATAAGSGDARTGDTRTGDEPAGEELGEEEPADEEFGDDALRGQLDGLANGAEANPDDGVNETVLTTLLAKTPKQLKRIYKRLTGDSLNEDTLRTALGNARGAIGQVAFSGVLGAGKLVFGLVIMVLALYYFLADGPGMLAGMMKLSPLDDVYERELLDKFANISRAVVVASLASAVVQGLLAGVGYAFALNPGAPIFLLTMLTMLLAIVPFAGAAAVWIPTVIWIALYQPVLENGQPVLDAAGDPVRGDTFTAICLAIYGTCVVSTIDNVIKPLVLHGQSNLHPLVALISILGGVQTLGPIGILVGPMLVAFIQALMNMINKELLRLGDGTLDAKTGARATPLPLGPATAVEAEATALTSGGMMDKIITAAAAAEDRADERQDEPKPPSPAPPKRSRRRK